MKDMSFEQKPKREQVIPPGLWVVATPIGNLADRTLRMEQALTQADLILAEDTRRAGILLQSLGIEGKRVERLDAHASESFILKKIEQLKEGLNLAFVSDAGTPGISDPGAALVAQAHLAKVRVTVIPGVSAVAALISVCGFEETQFTFQGFFPRESKARREVVLSALSQRGITVWYESPERIVDALKEILKSTKSHSDLPVQFQKQVLVKNENQLKICVAKELTKMHERLFWGDLEQVLSEVQAHVEDQGRRGEWAFALQNTLSKQDDESLDELESSWKKALECLAHFKKSVSVRDAAQIVSQRFGVAKNKVYQEAIKMFERD